MMSSSNEIYFNFVNVFYRRWKNYLLTTFQSEVEYEDAYECMLDGYNESYNKIVELGREDVNQYNIYIKFGCHENQSHKTAVSKSIF